jgi:inhibitor of cysteine peptidase
VEGGVAVAEVTISRSDDQKALHVAPGDIIVLHLPETPTSGYRWELSVSDGLQAVGDTYSADPASRTGGGGTRVFRLEAVHPGQGRLGAKLWRPWVGETTVVDRCEFLVEVA